MYPAAQPNPTAFKEPSGIYPAAPCFYAATTARVTHHHQQHHHMRINTKSGIPLYTAAYYDANTLIVAGGGGQGAHGVQNKIIVYNVSDGEAAVVSEFMLPANSDSPTSMTIGGNKIVWVGVNIPDEKTGKIEHLLKLRLNGEQQLVQEEAFDLFHSKDISVYQKATCEAGNMIACASSANNGLLSILTLPAGDILNMTFDREISDAAMSDYNDKEQRFIATVSDQEIEIRSISQPNVKFVPSVPAPKGGRWSRIVALMPGKFVAAASLANKSGTQLSVIEIEDFGVARVSHTVKITAFSGVTALATNGYRLAVASPSGDLFVYNVFVSEPTLVCKWRNLHNLPITAVAITDAGNTVASMSMDGSLSINTDIGQTASVTSTLICAGLASIVIMLVGLVLSILIFPVTGTEKSLVFNEFVDIYQRLKSGNFSITSFSSSIGSPVLEVESPTDNAFESTYVETSGFAGTAPQPTADADTHGHEDAMDDVPTPEASVPVAAPPEDELELEVETGREAEFVSAIESVQHEEL